MFIKFKIKSEAQRDLPHMSFLPHISEVIVTGGEYSDVVDVVDIHDGIEFRIHKKIFRISVGGIVMQVKITKPQVKKLLEQNGEVTLDLFERGKDPNHYMTAIYQITIKDINEIDGRASDGFKNFSGHRNFSMSIWKDEEEN